MNSDCIIPIIANFRMCRIPVVLYLFACWIFFLLLSVLWFPIIVVPHSEFPFGLMFFKPLKGRISLTAPEVLCPLSLRLVLGYYTLQK